MGNYGQKQAGGSPIQEVRRVVLADLLTSFFSPQPWFGECWLWLASDTEEVLLKGPRDASPHLKGSAAQTIV